MQGYLLLTILCEIPRVRTAWLLRDRDGLAAVMTTLLATRLLLLLVESIEKMSLLMETGRTYSKEITSGLLARASFWWLNSLLQDGYRNILALGVLPRIHEKLDSERLAERVQTAWHQCTFFSPYPGHKLTYYVCRQPIKKTCPGLCVSLVPSLGDPPHPYPKIPACRSELEPNLSHTKLGEVYTG